ncbi:MULTISPECIES: SAM-dependent methyltransferase [unclassified Streptomyces]|uniref:SAM-dependent methyltransferase n=1 Tax=unclassified Streptomyces TaxID=2593676 RepID=UPI002E812163|nr:SAM-dependent methyltransferase [Streptomyces sp. NBC_00589]
MPVIRLFSPAPSPGAAVLGELADSVTALFGLDRGHCWLWWQRLEPDTFHRPEWRDGSTAPAPVGFVVCKESYSKAQVRQLLRLLQERLGELLGVPREEVYLAVQRASEGELLVRDQVWSLDGNAGGTALSGDDGRTDTDMNGDAITDLVPIAHVHNERRELIDDDWGQVASVIRLDAERFTTDALLSLDSFSHLEVVFHFHRVPLDKVQEGARHPRNNPQWPLAGIFAQRGKNRPNRIGVSRCRLVKTDGLDLHVVGLDAVDGTPVLDIKPYLRQFGPREEVVQPEWVDELMRDYY